MKFKFQYCPLKKKWFLKTFLGAQPKSEPSTNKRNGILLYAFCLENPSIVSEVACGMCSIYSDYNSTEDIATELSTILKQSEDLIANKYLTNSHRTVLPSSSQNSRKSVLPSSSQNSRKSVPPSSSQNSSKSVLPSSSQNSGKSVLPSSSQNSRKSVLPSSSQNSRKSALSSLSEENQKKRNIVDQEIIDMVSGLNIYNVQIIDMKEVDRVSCYYPRDNVYKSDSSDEEGSVCCPGLR
ncbi:hypothetical protein CEXT_39301 [Caerostris extrusa]|uniref:Uncharacterized protein n=1 Tax=Caerostris extrusa TaxID=172846 RepID=A0AAV4UVJ1_CAEEX|nr:hypothetical protein CEXT_39301 [Caerostris extrusa]